MGDWTDDTDQLLCILQSLLANKGAVVETDIATRISTWYTVRVRVRIRVRVRVDA